MPIKIPFRFESEPLLWAVENIYTEAECRNFIELIEESSPTLATNNPLYRDQDRVIRDDPKIAEELFRRLRPHLPAQINQLRLVGLNDRLRMYRYREGQRFEPHMDHWYRPSENRISLHTVLVYFNHNFDGGETRFCEQIEQTIRPKSGMAAIFQHKIRHEGCVVRQGIKYAMRTDVIYEGDEQIVEVGIH
ncbi:MAG TPA: 2OG-Fe(II) oxygenase [Leptolyngbyaceae cyanobacterium]